MHTFPLFGAKEVAAGDGAVFVASSPDGLLERIDPATNKIVWKTKLHPWIYDQVLIAGGYAWMTTNSDGALFKFDLATGRSSEHPDRLTRQPIVEGDGRAVGRQTREAGPSAGRPATERTRTFPVGHAPAGMRSIGVTVLVGLIPARRRARGHLGQGRQVLAA